MTRRRATLVKGSAWLALLMFVIAVPIDAVQMQDRNHDSHSPARVSRLIQELHSPDLHRRVQAANTLAAMKPFPPEAIPALIQVLKNPDPMRIVQRFVVSALANAGAPAIPALSQLLEDKSDRNSEVRVAAVHVLGGMAKHEPAVWPILVGTFKDGFVQAWASIEIAKVGAPVVPLLRRALEDNNPAMRVGAVEALQMSDGAAEDAVPELANALKDPNPNIRALAADDLARIGPPAKMAVAALSMALKDPVLYVRDSAAYALAKVDPSGEAPIPILIAALEFSGSVQHWGAVEALGGMGSNARDAIPALEHLLATDPDARFRAALAKVLGPIAGANAVAPLARALTDDEELQVRRAALTALSQLGPNGAAAIPALVRALSDQDQGIRGSAADTLASLGKSATPALIAALKSPDLYTRQWAVKALAKSKPLSDEVVRALTAAASDDKNIVVRYEAANILDRAGLAGGHAALEKAQQEMAAATFEPPAIDTSRLYRRQELFADIAPDSDHEYPLHLFYLLSFNEPRSEMLVAVYRGQDRRDRLIFWRKAGDEKYRQLQVIDAGPDPSDTFDPPKLVSIKGQVPGLGVRFVQVGVNLWRGHGDYVFAIDGDELRPVEIELRAQWYRDKLQPGEEIVGSAENSFYDHEAEFRFYVRNGKKTEQVVGTYKLVKEIGVAAGAGTSAPFVTPGGMRGMKGMMGKAMTTWKLVVDTAEREPGRRRALPHRRKDTRNVPAGKKA